MRKRFTSLILVIASVLTFSMGLIIIKKELLNQSTMKIAIMSDLHIVSDSYFNSPQMFEQYKNKDKLLHISEAIAHSIADEIIAQGKVEAVLLPGDLTENGDLDSHKAVVKVLKKFFSAGIEVFVINGNHDIAKSPNNLDRLKAKEFKEIYCEYGYYNAVAKDENSLSYTADIGKHIRLIAIDNDNYYNHDTGDYKDEIDNKLLIWISEQLAQCKRDGKTPIAMAHKPFINHLGPIGHLLGRCNSSVPFTDLASLLADNECQYVFTGHLHGQDIKYYTSNLGNRFLEIQTSSTAYYPNAYRLVSFSKGEVAVQSKTIGSLKDKYINNFLTEKEKKLITSGFASYSYQHFCNSIYKLISTNFSKDAIMSILGLPNAYSGIATLIINNIIEAFITMPIYDEKGELSFNKIITMHGGQELPNSDYRKFTDLIAFFIGKINYGDEIIALDSVELLLLKKGILVLLYLVDKNSCNIAELYPNLPIIDLDITRLLAKGELELVESNILKLFSFLIKDSLPNYFQNININIEFLKGPLFENIMNGIANGLGTELAKYIGSDDLKIESFIDNAIYGELLKDVLIDNYPGDNNININRKTLEPIN